MKSILKNTLYLLLIAGLFISCEDVSDMAIERIASPVLVQVGDVVTGDETFDITTTIYELDKSGILDNTVGIDSLALPGLQITVVALSDSNVRSTIGTLTTDANGEVILSRPVAELEDISSLEWTGEYKGQSFTKISNY